MEPKNEIKIPVCKYEKPATKKHEAMNTVQGSGLYYSTSNSYSYTYTYYRIVLYK